MTDEKNNAESAPVQPGTVRNGGAPIRLTEINVAGISAEAARPGSTVSVFTRHGVTSEDPLFQRAAPQLSSIANAAAARDGKALAIERANAVLIVIHADKSADVWSDSAAVVVNMRAKRDMVAGSVVFENDIADVVGLWFPDVEFVQTDQIIVLIREGFRFLLFFDFNPDGRLDIEGAKKDLGRLYRRIKYSDIYSLVENVAALSGLIKLGWFPFIEIMHGDEFNSLAMSMEAGFPMEDPEAKLLAAFTEDRLEKMFRRWMAIPSFKQHEPILRAGLDAFKSGNAIAAIKILLSEIEGLLNDAYFAVTGERTRHIKKLIEFCSNAAAEKSGSADTLFLPSAFGQYLTEYTYAEFDHTTDTGSAGSRHAVGHGAAPADTYTLARALQAILTLDQLGFYLSH